MVQNRPQLEAPYLTGDGATLAAALLVRPQPALAQVRPLPGEPYAITDRAREQHEILLRRLAAYDVSTVVVDGSPDAGFGSLVADLAAVLAEGAIIMRPSALERRSETAAVEALLREMNIPVLGRIEPPGILDGGDILVTPETIFVGVAPTSLTAAHSNASGRRQFAEHLSAAKRMPVEVAYAPSVLRLRSVLSLVGDDTLVLAPSVVDPAPFVRYRKIEVPLGEEFAAGVLALGGRRVLANLRFRESLPHFRKCGLIVDAIDLWEFGKIGATPSLLTLALKRR